MICRSLRGAAGIFFIMVFSPFAIQDLCCPWWCNFHWPAARVICTDPRLHLFQDLLTGFYSYYIRFFALFEHHSYRPVVTALKFIGSELINNFHCVVSIYKIISGLIPRIRVSSWDCRNDFAGWLILAFLMCPDTVTMIAGNARTDRGNTGRRTKNYPESPVKNHTRVFHHSFIDQHPVCRDGRRTRRPTRGISPGCTVPGQV